MDKDPFKEYIREAEPDKREKGYAWYTAIGLQAVDGLKTSEYLLHTAVRNIEGEISIKEANELLQAYYKENSAHGAGGRTEEADKVSARIAMILSEQAFSFTPNEYIAIHRKLFTGIYSHAGRIRDYNITKKEWVLDGATVLYGSASELRATLEYDFSEEKKFSYRNLSMDEIIHHLAFFISRLWQIHVFGEGNTRTTAVFFIKYFRSLGFEATNDTFARNAWYFRNALVRANYNDLKNGIHETTEYLETFLRNLLLGENHPLQNRTMHISGTFKTSEKVNFDTAGNIRGTKMNSEEAKANIESIDVNVEGTEANIGDAKANIGDAKANIGDIKSSIEDTEANIGYMKANIGDVTVSIVEHFTPGTAMQVRNLLATLGSQTVFGRSDVQRILGLKATRSSELISEMLRQGVIQPVTGRGKGKYRFKENVL